MNASLPPWQCSVGPRQECKLMFAPAGLMVAQPLTVTGLTSLLLGLERKLIQPLLTRNTQYNRETSFSYQLDF